MRRTFEHDLHDLLRGSLEMLGLVQQMLPLTGAVLLGGRSEQLEEVLALDRQVDALEKQLEADCLRVIAQQAPVAGDLRLIALILKSLTDIERMGDYCVHVAEDGADLAQAPALKKYVNLGRMVERLSEMAQSLRRSIETRDPALARATLEMDDEVDELYEQIQRELVTYMLEDPRTISKALALMRVGRSLERLGDHMENVAERVGYWVTGER